MAVKRDSVNRKENLVKLPIVLPPNVKEGDTITLIDVVENDIIPEIKDPMAGFGNPDGSNYGDAVFDPMADGAEETVFDPSV